MHGTLHPYLRSNSSRKDLPPTFDGSRSSFRAALQLGEELRVNLSSKSSASGGRVTPVGIFLNAKPRSSTS